MTKINITNEEEFNKTPVEEIQKPEPEQLPVEAGEEQSFKPREICIDEKDKTLEKIYEDEGLQLIQKPPRMSRETLIIGMTITFVVGLIIGVVFTILFIKIA